MVNKDSSYIVDAKPKRLATLEEIEYIDYIRVFSRLSYLNAANDDPEDYDAILQVIVDYLQKNNIRVKDLTIWQKLTTRAVTCVCTVPHHKTGPTEAFVVSFRGTAFNATDFLNDAKSVVPSVMCSTNTKQPIGKVGLGFIHAYDQVRKTQAEFEANEGDEPWVKPMRATTKQDVSSLADTLILEILKQSSKGLPIFLTGHSLGGALSTLCMADLIFGYGLESNRVYAASFGSPRALGPDLAKKLDASGVEHYRMMNQNDPVPMLPPSLFDTHRHWGKPVSFEEINDTKLFSWIEFDHADYHGDYVELFTPMHQASIPQKPVQLAMILKTLVTKEYLNSHSIDHGTKNNQLCYEQKCIIAKATYSPDHAKIILKPRERSQALLDALKPKRMANPKDLYLCNACCCISQSLYCSKACFGCSRRTQCCCIEEQMCCAAKTDLLKCGSPKQKCCQIGCGCWSVAIVKPTACCMESDHCCCIVSQASFPCNNENPCMIAAFFCTLYPVFSCCKTMDNLDKTKIAPKK